MDIGRELVNQTNGIDVGQLAQRLGISEGQAGQAVTALLPAVLGGVKRAEQNGQIDKVGALGSHVTAPADDLDAGEQAATQLLGAGATDQVVNHAAQQSGLSQTLVRAMLPIVAGMIAQQVASRMGGGMLGNLAGSILGSLAGQQQGGAAPQPAPAQADAGGLGGMLGGSGLGGLLQSLDRDGDGNPLDDILGQFGGGQGR